MVKTKSKLNTDNLDTTYIFAAILELYCWPSHGKIRFSCMIYMFNGNMVAKLIKVIIVLSLYVLYFHNSSLSLSPISFFATSYFLSHYLLLL